LTIAGLDPLLRLGLVGGAGGSLSGPGDFDGVQVEGDADRRKSLPAAAAAAAQAPTAAAMQRRSALLFDGWHGSLLIVKPETVLRWRRRGWHAYWSWRSRRQRGRGGRRSIPAEVSLPSRNAANFSPRRSRPLERHYWLSSLHFAGASLRSWHGSHFLGRAAHESISRESQFNHQAPPPCRTNAAGAASGQAG